MQTLWLEDFIALAQTRSLSRAAELRHVTHPAFGRRIRALEAWAGTPLLERGGSPVRLTPAGEVAAGVAGRVCGEGFGRAGAHHGAAAIAALGAHVDEPVGGLDHVQVVLDDDDGVAGVAQLQQHPEQQVYVGKVQAGGGLVQDVEGAAGVAP